MIHPRLLAETDAKTSVTDSFNYITYHSKCDRQLAVLCPVARQRPNRRQTVAQPDARGELAGRTRIVLIILALGGDWTALKTHISEKNPLNPELKIVQEFAIIEVGFDLHRH
jgi:hypothetical protein